MVGPVVHQEMLLGSRRNRLHILRWIYATWLVVQVIYLCLYYTAEESTRQFSVRMMSGMEPPESHVSGPEVVGRWFTESFITQQMILLVLATPAFVAGAVTDEKRRGTLQYLLTTDLESRHIVLGKLLGRVAQVALLAMAGMPLFFLFAGFAGASPLTLIVALLVLVVPLLALGSATVLASVWSMQTRDAVLGLYVIGGLAALLVWYVEGPLRYFDPVYVLDPAWGPVRTVDGPELVKRLGLSCLYWGGLGALCLVLAVWRLRPAYIRELESRRPGPLAILGPNRQSVTETPVHWRERHVEGLAPVQTLRRVPQWLALGLVTLLTIGSSSLILASDYHDTLGYSVTDALAELDYARLTALFPDAFQGFLLQGVLAMLLASFVVGVRCSGAVTGERERKTWDSLLLTPISAREIVRGKLWGVMGASFAYLTAYAVPAIVLSFVAGPLAVFFTLLSLGVSVLAMYYIGAAGIWSSVKSKNSWRSLLATMGLGYVMGTFVYALFTPVIFIVYGLLMLFLTLIDVVYETKLASLVQSSGFISPELFFIASCIGLVAIFLFMSRLFLSWSQRWVADRERTRHWHDEPVYRRRRRVAAPAGAATPAAGEPAP